MVKKTLLQRDPISGVKFRPVFQPVNLKPLLFGGGPHKSFNVAAEMEPLPSSLRTHNSPPWDWTICWQTASPSPVPSPGHAAAQQAWLRLHCSAGQIGLQVIDDGRGMEVSNSTAGFGLRGLQERAAQLGGAISIADRPGGGTILSIQLPIHGG